MEWVDTRILRTEFWKQRLILEILAKPRKPENLDSAAIYNIWEIPIILNYLYSGLERPYMFDERL